jgi:hypothetical protein
VAGGLNGAACTELGLLLGALAAVLRVALTGVFFADAALVAGLAAGLAATLTAELPAADAGLAAVVTGVAEEDVAFMVTRLSKLTVHTVYTVDFEQARF